jgi:hypothetical protein
LNNFQDDEDTIDRLLRDTGFDDELGSDISLSDGVGNFNGSEMAQIVDADKPEQIAEDSVALVKEHETVVEEESLVSLNESQDDEDTIDRLLMDTGFDVDDVSLINEFNNDDDINESEITQVVETDESEQIADDCMDAGGRAPKVGALGDAGAVAESMSEQAEEKPDALIADDDYMATTVPGSLAAFPPSMEVRSGAVAEAGILDEFDDFSDFNDFTEPDITQAVKIDASEQIAVDPVAFVEEIQSVEDELGQAIEQPDALVEVNQTAAEPSLVSLNDLQNEEDAIDRLLLDTGFDADDVPRDDVDAFSGFGEIKDDFAESNMIQEGGDGKTVPDVADSVDFNGDQQAGLFTNAAEKRSDLMDDDKDLAEIDEFAQLDEGGDIFVEQNIDDFSDEPDKQEEQIQQAGSEEIAIQNDQDVQEDDFLLPDFDITADTENPDTWADAGIEEDKLAGAFNESDLFSDAGALEDELEKTGQALVSNEMPAKIKPKQSADNNAAVMEDAKNAVLSQLDAEPESTDEQYKKQIKDAENKAKKATIFSYVALGFCVVTFIAAAALAVMAYGAKTEILKLIELVSALEQGMDDGAIKNPDKENKASVEQLKEQPQPSSDLVDNKPPEVAAAPVAEAAKTEAMSKPETVKPEMDAAKTGTVPVTEIVKPEAEAAKVEAVAEADAAKPKTEAAKAVSDIETANPETDAVKSAAVLEAAVAKVVVATEAAAIKKTAAKKETIKKKLVKPTTKKAVAPVNWTVQLAAYKEEWYAKSKAAEFKQKGVPVEVVTGDVNNTAWYRLRVRGFKNKGEAVSYAARIKKALNLSSVTVNDN